MSTKEISSGRLNKWGIVSVTVLLAAYATEWACYSMAPQIRATTCYWLCFSLQSAAMVCGIVATRRGSKWWLLAVLPSAWLAFVCLLGEL